MSGISGITGLNTNPYVQNINKTRTKTVTSPVKQDEQKQTSTKKIATWATVIGGLLLTAGAIIASRGKAIKQQKLLSEIPKDLQARFEPLKNLKGKEFVDKAYSEMVDYMGLKGIAPQKVLQEGADGIMSVQGGYNMMDNTISYTSGFFTKLNKTQQINLLSHELKHCEQFTNMLRTEGITVEKYVQSTVDSMIKDAIKSPFNNMSFRLAHKQAVAAGKEAEFLAKTKENWTKDLSKNVEEAYKDVLKMPKFKADSPEGKKAFEHLKANSEYEGLDAFGFGSEAYQNNPLEVEAYAFGGKIEDMFKKFCAAYNI